MTDFAPLIANPKSALLGAAAQFGIFFALFGALGLSALWPELGFGVKEASAIGIIGGADGPTAIWLTSRLAPELLGAIAVAAYSYMALVPIIQPPIMKFLTTKEERLIKMPQLREVTKIEKIAFPLIVLMLCAFCVGTAGGVLMAKLMNVFCKKENRVNPLIGSAGVSAVPMAARVSNKVSLENDPTNYILMQAMGPNVSGVIGSAVVAGVLYTLCR